MNSPGRCRSSMDTMTRCCACSKRKGADAPRAFLDGEGKGQLDLPMARQGGFAGGLFAIFVPSPRNKPAGEHGRRRPRSTPPPGAPLPPPLELTTAQTAVASMASILIRIEREADGQVRICRTVDGHPPLHRNRRAGRGSAYRGRGGDRPGVRDARCAASGRTALARPGVEPAERVRARRAVPLSVVARHRAGPDRPRQGAGPRLQPAEDPDRPFASQREAASGTLPS